MPGTRPGMTSHAGSDLFVFPGAAVHPFVASCTSAIQVNAAARKARVPKLSGSPPLTIVRPCFGQNCIECLAGSSGSGNATALFRGHRTPGNVPISRVPTAKACDGKGEVW